MDGMVRKRKKKIVEMTSNKEVGMEDAASTPNE